MIERYQTPEMAELWSEAGRYRAWLEVELAAVDAWASLGEVPAEAARDLRERAARDPLDEEAQAGANGEAAPDEGAGDESAQGQAAEPATPEEGEE